MSVAKASKMKGSVEGRNAFYTVFLYTEKQNRTFAILKFSRCSVPANGAGICEKNNFYGGRSSAAPFLYSNKYSERVFSKTVNGNKIRLTESVNGGYAMNERFFSLPVEKQQAIINAGYRVFSQNSYKNSPMSEIADAAGISKSLLFHYFHNKKEL